MHRGKPWVTFALGLAACVNSSIPEGDVAAVRGTDSSCASPQVPLSCADSAVTEEAGPTSASDARVSSPRVADPIPGSDAGAAGLPEAGPAPGTDAGAVGARGEGGCAYLSQHFDDGVTFPANDGCNSCQCFGESAACTLVGCLRRPPHCDLPFDPGSCGESHTYYAHNPSSGLCEAKQYSGCGGNLNRFREYAECAYRCSLSEGPGRECTHEGRTYHHRERVARKPSEMTGCGPCLCNDGRVLCPPTDCKCPDGQKLGLQCVGCLAGGGCDAQEERCFPACDTDADCDTQYEIFCDKAQGVCVSTPACLGESSRD